MVHRHGLTWVLVFGVIVLMFLQLPPMAARQDGVVHTYSALVEVDALARQQFVERIDDDRLVDGAIRGMMLSLDPYSGYVAPDELPAFDRRSRGDFSGIGVELGLREGRITVIAPIEGSAAERGGVCAGDEILSVESNLVDELSVFDVEERLVGPPGTRVTLTLRRPGEREARRVSLVREQVHVRTVRGLRRHQGPPAPGGDYLLDDVDRIGYVRITSFRENTMRDFDAALRELLDAGAAALVLDLRGNPGGLMSSAISMADRFLSDGVIVSTVTRHRAVEEYRAEPEGTLSNLKLVILINGGSASASEIVAGSLQARGRAKVVGQRSFGKGSVQHLIRLTGHPAAVKLTVAYYRLPGGRIIHRTEQNAHTDEWGIRPDVEVAPLEEPSGGSTATAGEVDRPLDEALKQARKLVRS